MYGEPVFPGVSQAKLEFIQDGGRSFTKNGDEQLADGYLCIGVGGGELDEHEWNDRPRQKGECATTLVTKKLGLQDKPELRELVRFVRANDTKGVGGPFTLNNLLTSMHRWQSPEDTGWWINACYWAIITAAEESAAALFLPIGEQAFEKWHRNRFGVNHWQEVKALSQLYAHFERGGTGGFSFELSSLLGMVAKYFEEREADFERWANLVFHSLYQDGLEFVEAEAIAKRELYVEKVPLGDGTFCVVAAFDHTNEALRKIAIMKSYGICAGIVIQRNPETGSVQIYSKRDRVRASEFEDVARVVRAWERAKRGNHQEVLFENLVAEGHDVPGAECWYYFRTGQMLLNGSRGAPEVEPTALIKQELLQAVRFGLNSQAFYPDFASQCRSGVCAAFRKVDHGRCPWYATGLSRCQAVRAAQYARISERHQQKR
ncbi:MAG: hypothetical protein HY461_02195 [Parcubacteria group bacterium]|nr:hypothetical protein [Parcubacteria group bacterium]